MSVYQRCAIRGHVPTDLQANHYRSWGRSLGGALPTAAKFVIGGDVRYSTPDFLAALGEGLVEAGSDVVDLGIVPTPMVYYARRRLNAEGCAIVTASHGPPDDNGLLWMVGDYPPTAEEVAVLRRSAEGALSESSSAGGGRRSMEISHDYVAWLQETWVEARDAEAAIVLDPMYGCWSQRARRYLQAVYPRVVFSTVRDEPDPVFHGLVPDCSQPERIEMLCEAVEHQRAHLGIAFDGDGDCLALVDDRGVVLTAEEAAWVFLESLGDGLDGESFLYDRNLGGCLAERARELGSTPVAERSGRAFMHRRMIESGAVFGAGSCGHYFFRALDGGEDALFASCWLIDYLAHSGRSLSGLRNSCPAVYMTPELRLHFESAQARAILDRVQTVWPEDALRTTDGVRIDFPDGWASVRASDTETALLFRFEARGDDELAILVKRFCDAVPEIGEDLWLEFELGHGG